MIVEGALIVASAAESAADVDGGIGAERVLAVVLAKVLEASLVDYFRSKNLSVADLNGMFDGVLVISLRSKIELSDTAIVLTVTKILVACGQGVVPGEGPIETGSNVGSAAGIGNGLNKGNAGGQRGIEHDRIDRGQVVDVATVCTEEKRC